MVWLSVIGARLLLRQINIVFARQRYSYCLQVVLDCAILAPDRWLLVAVQIWAHMLLGC